MSCIVLCFLMYKNLHMEYTVQQWSYYNYIIITKLKLICSLNKSMLGDLTALLEKPFHNLIAEG